VGEITGRGRLRERTNVVPTSDDSLADRVVRQRPTRAGLQLGQRRIAESQPTTASISISHSRKDSEFAFRHHGAFEEAGRKGWLDKMTFANGQVGERDRLGYRPVHSPRGEFECCLKVIETE